MGTSSGSNHPHQMLPPRQQQRSGGGLETALSLVSSDQEPRRESPAESASSQETWPLGDTVAGKKSVSQKTEPDSMEQTVNGCTMCRMRIRYRYGI